MCYYFDCTRCLYENIKVMFGRDGILTCETGKTYEGVEQSSVEEIRVSGKGEKKE